MIVARLTLCFLFLLTLDAVAMEHRVSLADKQMQGPMTQVALEGFCTRVIALSTRELGTKHSLAIAMFTAEMHQYITKFLFEHTDCVCNGVIVEPALTAKAKISGACSRAG